MRTTPSSAFSMSTRHGRSLTISKSDCASSNWRCTRTKPGRGQGTCEAWRGEAVNLRLPRLHALLRAITQMGLLRHRAQDDQEAYASQAAGHQDRVAQDNARPHRENRCLGETDAARASELLRSLG